MSASLILWLGAAMAVFVTANTVLRVHAAHPSTGLVIVALVLYSVGNLMMIRLMRESGLAIAISVSAIVQLLLMGLIAWAVFAERPTPMQWAGMALGVVAVALIAWPQGSQS